MNYFQNAVEYDIKANFEKASELYESSIQCEGFPDAYINLAVLYFQFTDVGINASSQLPLEFIQKAFKRYEEVIDEGITRFPKNSEMQFWKKYFQHRVFGADLNTEEVLQIAKEDESSLIPYFFLYLINPKEYEEQRSLLLNQCLQNKTSKGRWILSLIE